MFVCLSGSAVVRADLSVVVVELLAVPVIGLVVLVGLATVVALFAGRERARRARLVLGDLLGAVRSVLAVLFRGDRS
ncbi:hypothetical protein ACFROC_10150 [Nocardia tengchongensis]|uniref:hypothetical protein n=1 Tax=Nocardia tengchongensis TaxID=2055889 RepID=UPI0036C5E653